jgi:hypothetical protein
MDLDDILQQADELSAYAENVIVIPKVDVIGSIPERFMLGYSVPSSYGGTPVSPTRFEGRRVHLLGGSWTIQKRYLRALGDSVVSLDNNSLFVAAMRGGDFYRAESCGGGQVKLSEQGFTVGNGLVCCVALSLGAIIQDINDFQQASMLPEST